MFFNLEEFATPRVLFIQVFKVIHDIFTQHILRDACGKSASIVFSLALASVIRSSFAVLLLFLHRRNAQIVVSVIQWVSVKVVNAHDACPFSVSPRVHNDLMDEYIVVARNISVCSFIPGELLTFVVGCLVFQYFLVARGAQFAVFVWFTIHNNRCDLAGLGVCDFPERIFHLVGGASERFRMAGFEGHGDGVGAVGGVGGGGSGSVFLGDIVVLLLELEHGVTK